MMLSVGEVVQGEKTMKTNNFIHLTRVFYDVTVPNPCYRTENLWINVANIVSVIDRNESFGKYNCRIIVLDNGNIYYVTESCEYIVNKMNTIVNAMEVEDNDWK